MKMIFVNGYMQKEKQLNMGFQERYPLVIKWSGLALNYKCTILSLKFILKLEFTLYSRKHMAFRSWIMTCWTGGDRRQKQPSWDKQYFYSFSTSFQPSSIRRRISLLFHAPRTFALVWVAVGIVKAASSCPNFTRNPRILGANAPEAEKRKTLLAVDAIRSPF